MKYFRTCDLTSKIWIIKGDREELLTRLSQSGPEYFKCAQDLQSLQCLTLPECNEGSLSKLLEDTNLGMVISYEQSTGKLSVMRLCKSRLYAKSVLLDNKKLPRSTERNVVFSYAEFYKALRYYPLETNTVTSDVKITVGHSPRQYSGKFSLKIKASQAEKIKKCVQCDHNNNADPNPSLNSESIELLDRKFNNIQIK